jgi:hypothetical protein
MAKYVFRSMAKLGYFRELHVGQTAIAYEGSNDTVVGHPLIPRELESILTNPQFANEFLWWATSSGSVSRQVDSGGVFVFNLSTFPAMVSFRNCEFDPNTKKIKARVCFEKLDVPFANISVSELEDFLTKKTIDILLWIKDKIKNLNKSQKEHLNHYIEVYSR